MPIRPENRERYPADWPAISNRIRFDRAGGRCECRGECGESHEGRCERTHGKLWPSADGVGLTLVCLTVGHLDHHPEHCADENLRAWCQRCHNRYDRPHRNATRARQTERLGQLTLLDGQDVRA
jgi:hypothetical protein